MKKTHWGLILPIATLIASCGGTPSSEGPRTVYFSEVFHTLESTYAMTKTPTNQLVGNFSLQIALVRNGVTTTETMYFYETGMTTVRTGTQSIQGTMVNAIVTTTYDYALSQGGVFQKVEVATNPTLNAKTFTPFSSTSLQSLTSRYDSINGNLNQDIRAKINAQVTNLAIGGQLETSDLKTYLIPINEVTTNYSQFSGVTGFTPTNVTLRVEYRTSTKVTNVLLNATATGASFVGTFMLSQPNTVSASTYTLSLSEKQTYQGF